MLRIRDSDSRRMARVKLLILTPVILPAAFLAFLWDALGHFKRELVRQWKSGWNHKPQ